MFYNTGSYPYQYVGRYWSYDPCTALESGIHLHPSMLHQLKLSIVIVKDPFGNLVEIEQELWQATDHMKTEDDIFDGISKVIEKPAMMFKLPGENPRLCYMRAIGWNKVLLVTAEKTGEHFWVVSLEIDPSAKTLSELYNWADQLL